jgi:hypothetical protein
VLSSAEPSSIGTSFTFTVVNCSFKSCIGSDGGIFRFLVI